MGRAVRTWLLEEPGRLSAWNVRAAEGLALEKSHGFRPQLVFRGRLHWISSGEEDFKAGWGIRIQPRLLCRLTERRYICTGSCRRLGCPDRPVALLSISGGGSVSISPCHCCS